MLDYFCTWFTCSVCVLQLEALQLFSERLRSVSWSAARGVLAVKANCKVDFVDCSAFRLAIGLFGLIIKKKLHFCLQNANWF